VGGEVEGALGVGGDLGLRGLGWDWGGVEGERGKEEGRVVRKGAGEPCRKDRE